MKQLIFAANWKMHLGPDGAKRFIDSFYRSYKSPVDREIWFFPSAVALSTVAQGIQGQEQAKAGAQNVFWEPKGAFTGELSVSMALEAGAQAALVGHSERRHVFGETDAETGRKVRAVLEGGLTPILCVGEKIEEREAGATLAVVERQLGVLDGLSGPEMAQVVVAYEPVWAIGTGKTATPADAAEVHAAIRTWFVGRGVPAEGLHILYGGSVKPTNAAALVSQPDIDGVLVGGASLDPEMWAEIASVVID